MSVLGNENLGMVITDTIIDEAHEFFVCLYEREEFKSLDVLRVHL